LFLKLAIFDQQSILLPFFLVGSFDALISYFFDSVTLLVSKVLELWLVAQLLVGGA